MATTNAIPNLHIYLNDLDPMIVARNIVLLKIISAPDFSSDNEGDLAFLWDVWYNAEWPQSTKLRFQKVLKELLTADTPLPENVHIPQSTHLDSLKEVWKVWSSICSKTPNQAKQLTKKAKKDR